jgi:hypothetical protein
MRAKMKVQQVNRLLDRMCLKRSLMLWVEWCFEDKLQKQLGLQSDKQMRMKPMLKKFLEWRDVSQEAKSRQKKLRKTVQRILRRTLVLAFDNWKESQMQVRISFPSCFLGGDSSQTADIIVYPDKKLS